MASIIADYIESDDHKVRCISYKDARSAAGKSAEDMRIGRTQCRVGCSSATLKTAKVGDIVVITAETKGDRLFHLGKLTRQTDECTTWLDQGGELWKYNWEYEPLTQDMSVKECTKALMEMGLSKTTAANLFNSRLCKQTGIYQHYIARLIREGTLRIFVRT